MQLPKRTQQQGQWTQVAAGRWPSRAGMPGSGGRHGMVLFGQQLPDRSPGLRDKGATAGGGVQ